MSEVDTDSSGDLSSSSSSGSTSDSEFSESSGMPGPYSYEPSSSDDSSDETNSDDSSSSNSDRLLDTTWQAKYLIIISNITSKLFSGVSAAIALLWILVRNVFAAEKLPP